MTQTVYERVQCKFWIELELDWLYPRQLVVFPMISNNGFRRRMVGCSPAYMVPATPLMSSSSSGERECTPEGLHVSINREVIQGKTVPDIWCARKLVSAQYKYKYEYESAALIDVCAYHLTFDHLVRNVKHTVHCFFDYSCISLEAG